MKEVQKKYKFAIIATDVVIFTIRDGQLQVLLIKMKKFPFGDCWAAPGGLVGVDESVDAAAKRHLFKKTGVKNVYLEQLCTFGNIKRDPFGRVVSVAYFALIPGAHKKLKTTKEYGDVSWFSIDKLPKMAYDHKEMIDCAISRLKSKIEYTNIVYSLLPEEFTLGELQQVYQIILNKKLDKRNFRRKILSLNLIKRAWRKKRGGASRPAELYIFNKRSPQIVEIL
jgi:8-oxo-dGTP diphosphatase